jgi:two-component system, chemotaxis family, response regulator Rcp1
MNARAGEQSVELLLVEDNPGDVLFTEEALRDLSAPVHLNIVGDGEEALLFLRRIGGFASAPRPDLILLDLNLPKISGAEVLAEVKRDPLLRRIPVVVFTTSDSEDDIRRTYDLHANCYITKPTGLNGYTEAMRSLENFWLSTAELPPR